MMRMKSCNVMMIKTVMVMVSILMILSYQIQAKHSKNNPFSDNAYAPVAEVVPTIAGGIETLLKQIKYPAYVKVNKVSGKVLALIYINENGGVDKITIIKGIENSVDEAVTNGIMKCRFNPGMNKGIAIKTKLAIKIMVNA